MFRFIYFLAGIQIVFFAARFFLASDFIVAVFAEILLLFYAFFGFMKRYALVKLGGTLVVEHRATGSLAY
jgi:hypothetical protein